MKILLYYTIYIIIMSYNRYKLDDITRYASLGSEYKLLSSYNPDWGHQLHSKGNTLDNDFLAFIAKEGLIRWYCNYIFYNKLDIDYNALQRITYLKSNIDDMSYYDWINIIKLCKYLKIENNIFSDYNFLSGWKYNFIRDKFACNKEYYFISMGKIIKIHYNDEINLVLNNLLEKLIDIKHYYKNNSIFETFLHDNPDIINFGIAFQRLKIVLEKMPVKNLTNNNSLICSLVNPDIYKFDKLCDDIQECIYSWIKNYYELFVPIKKEEVDIDYSKIELFMNKIEDSDISRLYF